MRRTSEFIKQITLKQVFIRMAIGALIGLALMALFILPIRDPNPEWGSNWRLRPLTLTPLITAFGFLAFFLKEYIQPKTDGGRILVFLISALAFVVSLWMGFVLGLVGTLWN
jgi:cbb3-type cytochrome oxidase subunit 1